MHISENMMVRQGNVGFQDVLDQKFMDENSKCETDDCDDGWQPNSDETEEESPSEIVTVAAMLTEDVNWLILSPVFFCSF